MALPRRCGSWSEPGLFVSDTGALVFLGLDNPDGPWVCAVAPGLAPTVVRALLRHFVMGGVGTRSAGSFAGSGLALRLTMGTSRLPMPPPRKAVGYTTAADGRKKRIYDKPKTPWQRVQASGVLDEQQQSALAARVEGINPADLTRQINAVQMQLLDLAKAKTEALAAARHVDLEALQPSIDRLAKAE